MAAPVISIASYTRTRISAKSSVNSSIVKFTANQNLIAWEARANGSDMGQGVLVGASEKLAPVTVKSANMLFGRNVYGRHLFAGQPKTEKPAIVLVSGQQAIFAVDNTELTGGDGTYRINVYGQNEQGEWSKYG